MALLALELQVGDSRNGRVDARDIASHTIQRVEIGPENLYGNLSLFAGHTFTDAVAQLCDNFGLQAEIMGENCAKLVLCLRLTDMRATLQDVSPEGALVRIPVGHGLPSPIHVIDLAERAAYECGVIRQMEGHCGLRFINCYALQDLPADLAYLRDIWMEYAMR